MQDTLVQMRSDLPISKGWVYDNIVDLSSMVKFEFVNEFVRDVKNCDPQLSTFVGWFKLTREINGLMYIYISLFIHAIPVHEISSIFPYFNFHYTKISIFSF